MAANNEQLGTGCVVKNVSSLRRGVFVRQELGNVASVGGGLRLYQTDFT
jgi:hypothetical protein